MKTEDGCGEETNEWMKRRGKKKYLNLSKAVLQKGEGKSPKVKA